MAATFTQALVAKVGDLAGLPNLWFNEVPEKTDLPHCVLVHQGETPVYGAPCPTPAWQSSRAQFLLTAKGLEAAEALAAILKAGLTPDSLDIDGRPRARLLFRGYLLVGLAERDDQGEQVFQATLSYELIG
jgi:hypothetical protein